MSFRAQREKQTRRPPPSTARQTEPHSAAGAAGTAPESAITRAQPRAERRDRTTTVAIAGTVQNGTSGRAHQPATAYIESDVRTSEAIIQSRRSALLAPRGRPAFGVHDMCGDSGLRQHLVRQGGRSLSGGNPTSRVCTSPRSPSPRLLQGRISISARCQATRREAYSGISW